MTATIDYSLPENIEFGRKLFAGPCDFIWAAQLAKELPPQSLPEVAFVGRSNVGKSTLINKLTNRKSLARTSHTPGRTQQLNFFNLGQRLILVDLPGYGYAKVGKDKSERWAKTIDNFLIDRSSLTCVLLLIDARRGLVDNDRLAIAFLNDFSIQYQIILTKADQISKTQLTNTIEAILSEICYYVTASQKIIATSCRDDIGIAELRAMIAAKIIGHEKQDDGIQDNAK